MSFIKHHLPKHLALWALGRAVDKPVDLSELLRVLVLSIGAVVVGAFLTLIAIGFGAAALYTYLVHDLALNEALSMMIVCVSCIGLAGGIFVYVHYAMKRMQPLSLSHFKDTFANMDGEIMHKVSHTLRSFAQGFTEK
jgi:hypothetical protein